MQDLDGMFESSPGAIETPRSQVVCFSEFPKMNSYETCRFSNLLSISIIIFFFLYPFEMIQRNS